MNLFIDIETLPALHWTPEERIAHARRKVPANYSKPESIEKWVAENADEEWRKTALDWRYGSILCIGYAIDDGGVEVISADENTMLDDLRDAIRATGTRDSGYLIWIGHNILRFDLRWLMYTALRLNHPLAALIPFAKWDRRAVDTAALWSGPDPSGPAKLADIAEYLGIGAKGEGLDGSKVYDAWLAGEHERIARYCAQDVELTRAVYRRITGGD